MHSRGAITNIGFSHVFQTSPLACAAYCHTQNQLKTRPDSAIAACGGLQTRIYSAVVMKAYIPPQVPSRSLLRRTMSIPLRIPTEVRPFDRPISSLHSEVPGWFQDNAAWSPATGRRLDRSWSRLCTSSGRPASRLWCMNSYFE